VAIDAIALMDALKIEKAVLGGFDWGARTADIVAALWPERCNGLVSVSGYLIGRQASGKAAFAAASRTGVVVPILFRHGARTSGLRQISAGFFQVDLAAGVAEMELRRCDIRSHRRIVRQS
jgi:pimeloyl-ACP methyl ester carboxylesterase